MHHFLTMAIFNVALLVASGPAMAESLAGKVGDKRYPVNIPWGSVGSCQKAYDDFICGAWLNAPSQKKAEALALKSCQKSVSKYKVQIAGACSIAASK